MSQFGTTQSSAPMTGLSFRNEAARVPRIVELNPMRALFLLSLVPLAACSSAGAKEEEKYEMVERQAASSTPRERESELCQQGKIVASAYLEERNEQKYKDWKLRSDIHCLAAQL